MVPHFDGVFLALIDIDSGGLSREAKDLALNAIRWLKPPKSVGEESTPYWRLFYHAVWSTKDRNRSIDDETAIVIERSIRSTLDQFRAISHAIGFAEDHIHIAFSLPPSIALSEVIGRMKGASAHAENAVNKSNSFGWQREYGVLSLGEKALPDVVSYIQNQKQRHESGNTWSTMELSTESSLSRLESLSQKSPPLTRSSSMTPTPTIIPRSCWQSVGNPERRGAALAVVGATRCGRPASMAQLVAF
jgi:putative transposase